MKIVVTGAAGFLGQRLAEELLQEKYALRCDHLVLVDINLPKEPAISNTKVHVECMRSNITNPEIIEKLINAKCDIFFHLAAIVSGHAEVDFDLGYEVNFGVTRLILERARNVNPQMKLVFTSTCGVFGSEVPLTVNDITATQPENSYGVAKAMSELLINDYTRKGFVDGRVVRLPTVTVRAGEANKAVTSFVSGIVREPLNNEEAICPVPVEQKIWICSPAVVVKNIIHAAIVKSENLGKWRIVNLPGITISVKDMIKSLEIVAGEKVTSLIKYTNDKTISDIVTTFPINFDNSRALNLGFYVDMNFEEIIRLYIKEKTKTNL